MHTGAGTGSYRGRALRLAASLSLLGLAACARVIPGAAPVTPVPPTLPAAITASQASAAPLSLGPSVAQLRISQDDAGAALKSFTESCGTPTRREDTSGLTRTTDWEAPCAAAKTWRYGATDFFETYFETATIGDGKAFATGYFEPEIRGSRTPRPGYDTPVYKMPDDLVRAWPADMPEAERTGRAPLGRIDANGDHVPYYERKEIEEGALAGRDLEIAWAQDPVELFFLQIQGSGRLTLADGGVMRIGYAGQNGRGYTGIGGVMRERGLLGDGPGQYAGSMQGIMQYIRENPEEGRELMQLNKSWIFFTELTGDGPLGSLGVPVRRESSVAVDPKFVPYGAPVWLDLDRAEADGLWIAQDTGGAIKGANRFDTFWGAGEDARQIAGGMTGRGEALIFLPKGTVDRLTGK